MNPIGWFGVGAVCVALSWMLSWEWLVPKGPRLAAEGGGRGFRFLRQ